MITIKLKRVGRKKKPFFHVIVIKNLSSTKGKYIELLGYFDPLNKTILKLNIEKIESWIKKGASISNKILFLIKQYKINKKFHCK